MNPDIIEELMTDFASEVYEKIEGKYPRFLVEEWLDQIRLSDKFFAKTLSPGEMRLVVTWATIEELSPEEFCTKTAEEALLYANLRMNLSMLYKTSLNQVLTSAPENLLANLTGIIGQAQGAMVAFANGDEELQEELLSLLSTMTAGIQENI